MNPFGNNNIKHRINRLRPELSNVALRLLLYIEDNNRGATFFISSNTRDDFKKLNNIRARSTTRLAIIQLIEQGYIIVKKHKEYWLNPTKLIINNT